MIEESSATPTPIIAENPGLIKFVDIIRGVTVSEDIDGRTGNLNVKAGNLVIANTTQLMTIQQIQPVYARCRR